MTILLQTIIRGYQLVISPFLGSRCRFYPSCSAYMSDAIGNLGARRGVTLGIKRFLKCHPWHPGGVDLPPSK